MSVRFETNAEPIPGYRLLDRLGSGGFGEVWRCEAPGGIFKAVKVVHGDIRSNDSDVQRYAEQELKSLKRVKSVRHPYLLSIDRFDIVEGRLCIVMELADCNLWDRFRECRHKGLVGIPRDELMVYMSEAGEVLDLMNDQFQLQHLDIKPQNLFLLYNHVKVADFGQVKDLEGHVASVTGGITPVYAAPETFDGYVSRFCDQYSLACVYQELLTGVRPFDGTSMQQLLMQHLQLPPNLIPSPPADRGPLARALAKKPDERYPSISALVRALKQGSPTTATLTDASSTPLASLSRADVVLAPPHAGGSSLVLPIEVLPAVTPLPAPAAPMDSQPPRSAPPEQTGPGSVRPTVVIGVGQSGLRILQRLRRLLYDRFGPPERTPSLRFLFIDTDADTLAAAVEDRASDGLASLRGDEVFPTKLNRAAHYMKPRLNGRSLVEDWFDPQLLYKLPRTPTTMGLRTLGRLAFCDHYRAICQKLQADLEACVEADALTDTIAHTGCALGTNRPRVYVVASLGGATGGGMFLDLAYAARNQLRRMGYSDPNVTGLLLLPPDGPAEEIGQHTQANAYAALTELNHFARPENVFHSTYDDRSGSYRDPQPPFTTTVMLPGPVSAIVPLTPMGVAAKSGRSGVVGQQPGRRSGSIASRGGSGTHTALPGSALHQAIGRANGDLTASGHDPFSEAAEYIRNNLFATLGRVVEEHRGPPPDWAGPVSVRTFGLAKFDWPRAEVIGRTARVVAGVVLDHWVSPNFGRAREQIPGWAIALSVRLRLDPDGLSAVLTTAGDMAAGGSVETHIAALTEPIVPIGGWRTKLPEPSQIVQVLSQIEKLLGPPVASVTRPPSAVGDAVRVAGSELFDLAQVQLPGAVTGLIDDVGFRLAGAEEAARHLMAGFDRGIAHFVGRAEQAEAEARRGFELLSGYAHSGKGRVPSATEMTDALRNFPRAQFAAMLARRAAKFYEHMKQVTTKTTHDVAGCRQRLDGFHKQLVAELELPAPRPGSWQVLPAGCSTVEEAAQKFLTVLTDDDLTELEHRVQTAVAAQAGGLYQACLNTAGGTERLLRIVQEETRAYLDTRLGPVDLAAMLAHSHGGAAGTAMLLGRGFKDAQPELIGPGPWTKIALAVVAAPPGPAGDPLVRAAGKAAPPDQSLISAEAADEVVVYREYPHVPLAALPQCGPAWATAYEMAPDLMQTSPHTRIDIPAWTGVDTD